MLFALETHRGSQLLQTAAEWCVFDSKYTNPLPTSIRNAKPEVGI